MQFSWEFFSNLLSSGGGAFGAVWLYLRHIKETADEAKGLAELAHRRIDKLFTLRSK